jgi:amidase
LDDVIKEHQLDAICGLTMGPRAALILFTEIVGDVTTPAAASGYPHITVPCGKVYDLPVGFGKPYSEPELIGMAYANNNLKQN